MSKKIFNSDWSRAFPAMRSPFTGFWAFGAFMVFLGLLIFMVPELIGFLFGAFIIFLGGIILYSVYKVQQFQKEFFAWRPEPVPVFTRPRPTWANYSRRRTIFILR